jgi:hypothetical protein
VLTEPFPSNDKREEGTQTQGYLSDLIIFLLFFKMREVGYEFHASESTE